MHPLVTFDAVRQDQADRLRRSHTLDARERRAAPGATRGRPPDGHAVARHVRAASRTPRPTAAVAP